MVKLYGFCLSIAYVVCPHQSYIESLPTLWLYMSTDKMEEIGLFNSKTQDIRSPELCTRSKSIISTSLWGSGGRSIHGFGKQSWSIPLIKVSPCFLPPGRLSPAGVGPCRYSWHLFIHSCISHVLYKLAGKGLERKKRVAKKKENPWVYFNYSTWVYFRGRALHVHID